MWTTATAEFRPSFSIQVNTLYHISRKFFTFSKVIFTYIGLIFYMFSTLNIKAWIRIYFLFLIYFISISQMKLAYRKFKWNKFKPKSYGQNSRKLNILKRKYTEKHENSTFIDTSALVLIDTWCSQIFKQTFKSWWLFWRGLSTSAKICTLNLFANDLLAIYMVSSTDLSQDIVHICHRTHMY